MSEYFGWGDRKTENVRFSVTQSVLVLSDEALVVTGTIASVRVVDGQPMPDRVTFVIVRRDGQ